MTTDRFDNIPLADLIVREQAAADEVRALIFAIKARLLAVCPIVVGGTYRVTRGASEGRLLRVKHLHAQRSRSVWNPDDASWHVVAEGTFMLDKASGGRDWSLRSVQVRADFLELAS